jgi:hypothetical protein
MLGIPNWRVRRLGRLESHVVPTEVVEAGANLAADWPEDIAQFCNLLVTGPGEMIDLRYLTFRVVPLSNFSTAENSKVPHNALHDARALRDHYRTME